MKERNLDLIVSLAGLIICLLAIALAFMTSVYSFWWCPEGSCPLSEWNSRPLSTGNLAGIMLLMVFFTLLLTLVFILLARPFVSRTTIEKILFEEKLPLLGWLYWLLRKWVGLLWRDNAA